MRLVPDQSAEKIVVHRLRSGYPHFCLLERNIHQYSLILVLQTFVFDWSPLIRNYSICLLEIDEHLTGTNNRPKKHGRLLTLFENTNLKIFIVVHNQTLLVYVTEGTIWIPSIEESMSSETTVFRGV